MCFFIPCPTTYHACPPRGGMAFGVTESAEASAVPHLFFRLSLPCMPHPPGVRDGIWCCGECRGKCSAAVRNFFLCGHLVAMENA